MKIYKVKVNGKLYEVELESVTDANSRVVVSAPKTQTNNDVKSVSSGAQVKAPMQGVILDIKAKVGDRVQKGQVLFILEAMKLENEIVSPADGTLKQILVNRDQNVANQDVLAIIE